MIRDLAGVLQREHAEAGVFVCLNEPTKEMRNEAHSAGRATLPAGDRPKVQIVTAKDLIAGPDLGITTALDVIGAADAARNEARRNQKSLRKPTPAQLRRELPLPSMPIAGGKRAGDQQSLELEDPVLVSPQPRSRSRKRG